MGKQTSFRPGHLPLPQESWDLVQFGENLESEPLFLFGPKDNFQHCLFYSIEEYAILLNQMIHKSSVTNFCCLVLILLGHTVTPEFLKEHVLGMGYFGFSGAVTNWLAVHMLFERVPGLYGSGIIPLKFESFKSAIRDLIMTQFFTRENIEKFIRSDSGFKLELEPVLENLDYDRLFDGFVEVVKSSKFGGMLGLFGGEKALESMREPFAAILKKKLLELTRSPEFLEKLSHQPSADVHEIWQRNIAEMVDSRLRELTPKMVKEIIQKMIRSHLGWLVIWGGVFGSLIGLLTSFL